MRHISIIILSTLLLFTCEKASTPIPSYIYLHAFSLNTELNQGVSTHNISDAYIYIDNQLLGAYSLPAKIPYIGEGEKTIKVDPIVRINGISETPFLFPFYERFETLVNLKQEVFDTVYPVTKYKSDVIFEYIEDFESGNSFVQSFDDNNIVSNVENSSEVSSNILVFDLQNKDDNLVLGSSRKIYDLPKDLFSPHILELDYKNDIEFGLGIVFNGKDGDQQHFVTNIITPKTKWSKIYFNFTSFLFEDPSPYESYQIFFQANLANGEPTGKVLIDNLKMTHQ